MFCAKLYDIVVMRLLGGWVGGGGGCMHTENVFINGASWCALGYILTKFCYK